MSTRIATRRSLVKGAAWAAPAIIATTTVPAYAASPGVCDLIEQDIDKVYDFIYDNDLINYDNTIGQIKDLDWQEGATLDTYRQTFLEWQKQITQPALDDLPHIFFTIGQSFVLVAKGDELIQPGLSVVINDGSFIYDASNAWVVAEPLSRVLDITPLVESRTLLNPQQWQVTDDGRTAIYIGSPTKSLILPFVPSHPSYAQYPYHLNPVEASQFEAAYKDLIEQLRDEIINSDPNEETYSHTPSAENIYQDSLKGRIWRKNPFLFQIRRILDDKGEAGSYWFEMLTSDSSYREQLKGRIKAELREVYLIEHPEERKSSPNEFDGEGDDVYRHRLKIISSLTATPSGCPPVVLHP